MLQKKWIACFLCGCNYRKVILSVLEGLLQNLPVGSYFCPQDTHDSISWRCQGPQSSVQTLQASFSLSFHSALGWKGFATSSRCAAGSAKSTPWSPRKELEIKAIFRGLMNTTSSENPGKKMSSAEQESWWGQWESDWLGLGFRKLLEAALWKKGDDNSFTFLLTIYTYTCILAYVNYFEGSLPPHNQVLYKFYEINQIHVNSNVPCI